MLALPARDLFWRRDDHPFNHVTDHFIRQQENRQAVAVCHVETMDGQVEHFLGRPGRIGDRAVISVRAPARLHHVGLPWHGRQTGGRGSALHIDDHAGDLQHHSQADVFHHQAQTRPRCGGHGARAGGGSSEDGSHAGQFILHLDEYAPHLGQAARQVLCDLGGWGDRVTAKKVAASRDRAFGAGFVPVHKVPAGQDAFIRHLLLR